MDKPRSILVVEDDDAVRTMIVRQLSSTYTVTQAVNAQSALAMLEGTGVPDLIISDVMMPGISGMELVRRLKKNPAFKSVPIIFLTAKSSALDVIEGINSGARHYLTKPFQMKDLLDKVAKAIQ